MEEDYTLDELAEKIVADYKLSTCAGDWKAIASKLPKGVVNMVCKIFEIESEELFNMLQDKSTKPTKDNLLELLGF